MNPRLTISVCTYQSGDFDLMLIDKETGEEVCFSGNQKITDEQLDIVERLAPACVWTTYYPSEQYKALQARCDKLEAAARVLLRDPEDHDGENIRWVRETDLNDLRSALSPKENEDE